MNDHADHDELIPAGADVDRGQLVFASRCYAEVAYNITSALRYAHGDGPRQADHYEGDDRARILSMLEDIKADPVGYHYGRTADGQVKPPGAWPWEPDMWAPYPDPERNLITARNLLDAEIARVAEVSGVPVGGGEPQPGTDDNGLVWCVKHRDGWCATRDNHEPAEGTDNVPTRCGFWVVLPAGYDRREPDCSDCRTPVPSAGGGDQPDTPCPQDQP